jgi:hypothetical protein
VQLVLFGSVTHSWPLGQAPPSVPPQRTRQTLYMLSQISLPAQLPCAHCGPPPGLQPCLQKRSMSQENMQLLPPHGELHSEPPMPGVPQGREQMFPEMHICPGGQVPALLH